MVFANQLVARVTPAAAPNLPWWPPPLNFGLQRCRTEALAQKEPLVIGTFDPVASLLLEQGCVRMPIANNRAQIGEQPMPGTSNRVRNLMVVEDEPLIAMMMQDELESMGIHVIGPVSNLKSALRLAGTLDLDGALLDRNINGTFADEVADMLRIRKVPFVFVSGYERPAGLRHRDVPVLHKPFGKIEFRMTLLALLERTNP